MDEFIRRRSLCSSVDDADAVDGDNEEGAPCHDSHGDDDDDDCHTTIQKVERDDDGDVYEGLGSLFEGAHPTTLKYFEWHLLQRPRKGKDIITISDDDDGTNITSNGDDGNNNSTFDATTSAIRVAIRCIDDEPGAVQSGHYLWPAASALVDFLVASSSSSSSSPSSSSSSSLPAEQRRPRPPPPPRTILELGAGTALVSLAALQIYGHHRRHRTPRQEPLNGTEQQRRRLRPPMDCGEDAVAGFVSVITDRDPTVLERARNNYEATRQELLLVHGPRRLQRSDGGGAATNGHASQTETDDAAILMGTATVTTAATAATATLPMISDVVFHQLHWGDMAGVRTLQRILLERRIHEHAAEGKDGQDYLAQTMAFDLILGSDLIYCLDVVRPLFQTVAALLMRKDATEEGEENDVDVPDNALFSTVIASVVPSRTGRFLLSQSFAFDPDIEDEICRQCEQHRWDRNVLVDALSDREGVKIQEFVPRSNNHKTTSSLQT